MLPKPNKTQLLSFVDVHVYNATIIISVSVTATLTALFTSCWLSIVSSLLLLDTE